MELSSNCVDDYSSDLTAGVKSCLTLLMMCGLCFQLKFCDQEITLYLNLYVLFAKLVCNDLFCLQPVPFIASFDSEQDRDLMR